MNANLPTMVGSAAASSTYSADALFANNAVAGNGLAFKNAVLQAGGMVPTTALIKPQGAAPMSTRRIVQVFVADPNDNLSLDDCLLFKGEEKLTDATDQELFFELDIKNMLEIHNAKRIKIVDKKVKDRTEYLEPAKVRDLKMVVVTVASL